MIRHKKVRWFWYRKARNQSADFADTCNSIFVFVRKGKKVFTVLKSISLIESIFPYMGERRGDSTKHLHLFSFLVCILRHHKHFLRRAEVRCCPSWLSYKYQGAVGGSANLQLFKSKYCPSDTDRLVCVSNSSLEIISVYVLSGKMAYRPPSPVASNWYSPAGI